MKERYQPGKLNLNVLECYINSNRFAGGAYLGVDDGYIYIEVSLGKFDSRGPIRYYFVQYYNDVSLYPQDEFEAHYRNIEYFVDDEGHALKENIVGSRPSEEERNKMIENIKNKISYENRSYSQCSTVCKKLL